MKGVNMNHMDPDANWDISTEEGMANSIEWTRRQFALLKDGGTWIVPRSGTIVTVDHTNKRATKSGRYREDAVRRVVEAMGWEWVDATNNAGL